MCENERDKEVRFARGGNSSPFGKSSEEVRVMVPERIRNELIAMSVLRGQTLSEYCRNLFIEHLHGRMAVIMPEQSND